MSAAAPAPAGARRADGAAVAAYKRSRVSSEAKTRCFHSASRVRTDRPPPPVFRWLGKRPADRSYEPDISINSQINQPKRVLVKKKKKKQSKKKKKQRKKKKMEEEGGSSRLVGVGGGELVDGAEKGVGGVVEGRGRAGAAEAVDEAGDAGEGRLEAQGDDAHLGDHPAGEGHYRHRLHPSAAPRRRRRRRRRGRGARRWRIGVGKRGGERSRIYTPERREGMERRGNGGGLIIESWLRAVAAGGSAEITPTSAAPSQRPYQLPSPSSLPPSAAATPIPTSDVERERERESEVYQRPIKISRGLRNLLYFYAKAS